METNKKTAIERMRDRDYRAYRDERLLRAFLYQKGLWNEYRGWVKRIEEKDPYDLAHEIASETYHRTMYEIEDIEIDADDVGSTHGQFIRRACGSLEED